MSFDRFKIQLATHYMHKTKPQLSSRVLPVTRSSSSTRNDDDVMMQSWTLVERNVQSYVASYQMLDKVHVNGIVKGMKAIWSHLLNLLIVQSAAHQDVCPPCMVLP